MNASDARHIADRVRADISLADLRLPDEYFYASPTLCVLDAVFSIGVRYESVRAVVQRYCSAYQTTRIRPDRFEWPPRDAQESLTVLANRIDEVGPDAFAASVVCNRQRTSTRGGVLKSTAAAEFARTLAGFGIEYFQDLPEFEEVGEVTAALRMVHGQSSGVSISYFWMLAGSDELIKADRMILAFLKQALNRTVEVREARSLLQKATALLQVEYASLTPRLLDYKIWDFQRSRIRVSK